MHWPKANQHACESEDLWQQREELHSCVQRSKMVVTRAAQEEMQGDAQDWMREGVWENEVVVTRTLAESEPLHRGGDNSWFVAQKNEMKAEEIVLIEAGGREMVKKEARRRTSGENTKANRLMAWWTRNHHGNRDTQ